MYDPRAEYEQRLHARNQTHNLLVRRDRQCANARLIIFTIGLLVLWAAFMQGFAMLAWLFLPVATFLILLVIHERTLRALRDAKNAVQFYETGVARLNDKWIGTGIPGNDLAPTNHLYAEDIDLFGSGSLFELMCAARTRAGEETLAAWMCAPAPKEEIEARQQAIEELRLKLDLRESLALLAADVRARVRPKLLQDWASAPNKLTQGFRRWLAMALTAAAIVTFTAWAFEAWSLGPFVLCVIAELIYLRWSKAEVHAVLAAMDEPMKDLKVFSSVAQLLEQSDFHSEKLRALQSELSAEKVPASRRVAQLARLFQWVDAANNQIFAPVAIVLLWTVHFAYAIERWRVRYGAGVPRWLAAIGEFEALCSIAGYAYEHPDDPFPDIVEGETIYDGKELGHPLLPSSDCIRNSVSLGESPSMLIVSGSNMSGKSTLLRVVGINATLAFMGAPIRGASLRLSPLAIGASLHIVDSIQGGTSHFYAEITRLHEIMKQTKTATPVLFLVDEILHGTNSHDRRTGAEAVLKGLVKAGGIGLVTTHDLALTKIVDTLGERAKNVHFVDHLEDGRLTFDYTMRQGVVERSNALSLMRAIGLDI